MDTLLFMVICDSPSDPPDVVWAGTDEVTAIEVHKRLVDASRGDHTDRIYRLDSITLGWTDLVNVHLDYLTAAAAA